MKVQQLIEKLQNLKEGMGDKEIKLQAPNGMLFTPQVKFALKELGNPAKTIENTEYILLTW